MKASRIVACVAVLASSLVVAGGALAASDFPSKPIKIIVPFSPGGSSDMVARTVAKLSEKYLGQPMVVENKPGAGSMLGLNAVIEAKPDGYTIGLTNSGLVTQSLYGTNKYDYPTAMEALAQVGEIPFVFAVRTEAPWKTLPELVAYAKANPKKLKYGITGYGNTAHLGPENLELEAKIEMEPVNFDGGAPLLAAMLGGHIDGAANNPVDLREHLKAGKARVLVVFGEKRINDALLKDVPTAREFGYDILCTLWQGFGAPKNMPEDVKAKLGDGLGKIIKDPETQAAIAGLGLEPVYLSPKEFAAKWVSDQKRIGKLVADSGILAIIKGQTK